MGRWQLVQEVGQFILSPCFRGVEGEPGTLEIDLDSSSGDEM